MVSDFKKALADIAIGEYYRIEGLSESDVPLADRIRKYWTDLKHTFPGVNTA
jgi:hypothetical protein